MCGVSGFFGLDSSEEELKTISERMRASLRHRGPDSCGIWIDQESGLGFGHTRLSVLDTTARGSQPMRSRTGRYVLNYNGEIYNFKNIRTALSGAFQSNSDTEVILAAVEEWGVKRAIQELRGIFAFALWDREARCLFLVRDRVGVKPLYYCWVNGALVFASEVRALLQFPGFTRALNVDALGHYFQFGYLSSPGSVYKGVRQVPTGCILTVGDGGTQNVRRERYWSITDVVRAGTDRPFTGTVEEATDRVDDLLDSAVREELVSDVPVGILLSGGIDSSIVAAYAMKAKGRGVQTFSVGFGDGEYDEAPRARAVAAHLGTVHKELYVDEDHLLGAVHGLAEIYDEPFADSSQIPTWLISREMRKEVTVALSGDGGDEAFGGYNRYVWGPNVWRRMEHLPVGLRRTLAGALEAVPGGGLRHVMNFTALMTQQSRRIPLVETKARKVARMLRAGDASGVWGGIMAQWEKPEDVLLNWRSTSANGEEARATGNLSTAMMLADVAGYLPDDILVKVDRASMNRSLEVRVPLLDHRLLEFAWSLPLDYKIRDRTGKWILRQVLSRYVPAELTVGPKRGFVVPIGRWLRGPLRDWAESLLTAGSLDALGILDTNAVRSKWEAHKRGRDGSGELWTVLMFQAWAAKWL